MNMAMNNLWQIKSKQILGRHNRQKPGVAIVLWKSWFDLLQPDSDPSVSCDRGETCETRTKKIPCLVFTMLGGHLILCYQVHSHII